MKKIIFGIIIISGIIISCNNSSDSNQKNEQCYDSLLNYQHLTGAVNWYEYSAEMRACYYQAYNNAKRAFDENSKKSTNNKKKAVVLDIDETVLNNSPFEMKSIETGKGYSKESWKKWSDLARAAALPGVLEFINYVKSKNAEVFYISNRRTNEIESTKKNLDSLGFPFVDNDHLIFRTEESSKKKRREKVSETHEIILLVGDNLADLSEIFETRTANYGKDLVDQNKELFGTKYIILPNPMYGDWEMVLQGMNKEVSDSAKGKILRNGLNSGY